MAFDFDFDLKIQRQTYRLFKKLETPLPRKELQTASYRGGLPVFRAVRALAPSGPPKPHVKNPNAKLKTAIRRKHSDKKLRWIGKSMVGFERNPIKGGAPHEHLVAFGTKGRREPGGRNQKPKYQLKGGKMVRVMVFKGSGTFGGQWFRKESVAKMPPNSFWRLGILMAQRSSMSIMSRSLLSSVKRLYKAT